MKRNILVSAFSLVEVALALGITAFCLLAVLGTLPVGVTTQRIATQQTTANAVISQVVAFLRADVRLPPGQADNVQGVWANLKGHWAQLAQPDTLFFTNEAKLINASLAVPANAVFRVRISYYAPPNPQYTTSLADITVSWPAQVDPTTGGIPEGSVETFVAVNR